MSDATSDPLIGKIIGEKYKILTRIGVGGMGGVYKAQHLLIDRIVAIKVLRNAQTEDDTQLKRFHQEARTASQLSHPNAVTLFDFGVESGAPYLVMEYINGRTLKEVLAAEGPLPVARTREILRQVCAGLREAHNLGIIHRDLKPDNVMFRVADDGAEIAKVLDFGIAKSTLPSADVGLTMAGMLVGTPQYMAPEQCQGKAIDARSDVFSLGVIIHEMLTGERPFRAEGVIELLSQILSADPEPASVMRPDLEISSEIDKVILKSLSKNPNDRYSSVQELFADFEKACPAAPTLIIPAPFSAKNLISGKLAGVVVVAVLCVTGLTYVNKRDNAALIRNNGKIVGQPVKVVDPAAYARMLVDLKDPDVVVQRKAVRDLIAVGTTEALAAVEHFQLEEVRRKGEQAELAEKARKDAIAQAELAKAEAQKLAEAVKRAEADTAEAERKQLEQQFAAELAKEKAQKEAETAKAEAARIAAAAQQAEQEKSRDLQRQLQAAKQAETERNLAVENAKRAEQEAERIATEAKRLDAERQAAVEKLKAERVKAQELLAKQGVNGAEVQRPPAITTPDPAVLELKAKLAAQIKKAEEQQALATQRSEALKREQARQKKLAAEAEVARQKQEKLAEQGDQKSAEEPANAGAQEAPKKRRRCGPTWCL